MAIIPGYQLRLDLPLTFRETATGVVAETPGANFSCPVTLPDWPLPESSTIEKVKRLLKSPLIQPVYLKETSSVTFEPNSLHSWEIVTKMRFPFISPFWIPRSGSKISFFHQNKHRSEALSSQEVDTNEVVTWDWRTDRCSIKIFGPDRLSIISELPNGKLLAGNFKGCLYISKGLWCDTGVNSPVGRISLLGKSHLAADCGSQLLIIDTESRELVQTLSNVSNAKILNDQILSLEDNQVLIWSLDTSDHVYKSSKRLFQDIKIENFTLSCRSIVILHDANKQGLILWDVKTDTHRLYKKDELINEFYKYRIFAWDIDSYAIEELIALPCPPPIYPKNALRLKNYLFGYDRAVNPMQIIYLSCGLIMYSDQLGVKFISKQRELGVSLQLEHRVCSLHEMEDDYVIVASSDGDFTIIRPIPCLLLSTSNIQKVELKHPRDSEASKEPTEPLDKKHKSSADPERLTDL